MEEPTEKTNPWPFRLWVAAVILLALTGTVLITALAVRQALMQDRRLTESQTNAILAIAEFPYQIGASILQIVRLLSRDPYLLLVDKKTAEQSHWQRSFPAVEDTGYLLFSGVDRETQQSIVSLIRVANGDIIVRWVPDWKDILKKIPMTKDTKKSARAFHPMLMPDGSVIFNTASAMVRMGHCSRKPVWVLNDVMHHSVEIDNDGNILAPAISLDGFADNPWLQDQIRDDAIAKVSPEGRLLEKRSFAKIMRENGLQALLLGTHGKVLNKDPIHLNQITVARATTEHWQRGDLLISARHSSTVFLYRPATGRIIWHKTGPWMNQHSVAFIGDHQILVFNNNVISASYAPQYFMVPGNTNGVMVYDFVTQQVSEPYAKLMVETRPVTVTEGRAQLLPDGGLFIEESEVGRHLRFTKDRLLWSRINDYDDKQIGIVSWSRYLTQEEVALPLQAIANSKCPTQK